MSDKIIFQFLLCGLNAVLKKEISRRESSITSLSDFLHYAKLEDDLYDKFEKSHNLSLESQQPHFNYDHSTASSLVTRTQPPYQYYHHPKRDNRQPYSTQPQRFTHPPPSAFQRQQIHNQPRSQHQFNNCKVCNRTNHRTIDCFYKRSTGCFNCGQNHNVRDCILPPNFQ